MGDIKLVYFDLRGRGEYIRLVLEAAGQKYSEQRLTFEEWPAVKPNTLYNQLPVLEYKGKKYGQSNAIAEFLAREFGLFGKTNLDGLRIGEVIGLWNDQMTNVVKSRFNVDDAAKEEFKKKVIEEDLPKFFGILESLLKEGGSSGYFVNNALSLADLYVYDMQDNMIMLKADALAKFPLLTKLRSNIESHPKLKAYLAKRAKTMF